MNIAEQHQDKRTAPRSDDAGLFADLVKAETLIKENPDLFNKGRLAWWVQCRHHNGAAACGAILVHGRRAFFHRKKLLSWLRSQDRPT